VASLMSEESFRVISGTNLHVPIPEGVRRLNLQQEDGETSAEEKRIWDIVSEVYEEADSPSDQARKLLDSKEDAPNREP